MSGLATVVITVPPISADDALNTVVPDYLMLGLTYIGAARFCLEELKLVKEFVVLDRDRTARRVNETTSALGGNGLGSKVVVAAANQLNAAVGNTGVQRLPNGGQWPAVVPGMTRPTLITSQSVGNWKSVGHVRSLLSDEELPVESTPLNMRKVKVPKPPPYYENLTVYDLIAHVKKWLKIHGEGDESVVEVLQRKGWGKEYLGPAKVFYSHSQSEHPAEMMAGLTAAAFEVAGIGDTTKPGAKWNSVPVWVDAFSLRQTAEERENRWDANQIAALIKKIGCTVATVDNTRRFLTRSMCIMESFATITTGGQLLIRPALNDWLPDIFDAENTDESQMDVGEHSLGPILKGLANSSPAYPCCCLAYWLAPQVEVDAANAETSDPEDKAMVDRWIQERPGGFETVNQTMEREMRKQQGMLGCNRAISCINMCLTPCGLTCPFLCLLSCQDSLPRWYKKLCIPMII